MNDGAYTADCDADGWTVFQSRGQFGNEKTYFKRDWDQFVKGFGRAGNKEPLS